MDHIKLKDGDLTTGVLCIDRELQICSILQTSLDEIDKLVTIAKAQGVPQVQIVMPEELVDTLLDKGWKLTNLKVLVHD